MGSRCGSPPINENKKEYGFDTQPGQGSFLNKNEENASAENDRNPNNFVSFIKWNKCFFI
jgi:hypothetical protein